jgi:protein-disulfide isomerase
MQLNNMNITMQKAINRILLIILFFLIALLVYRTLSVPKVSSTEIVTTVSESHHAHTSPQYTKEDIQGIVKEYLIENPEVIIAAIENMQKRKIMENQLKLDQAIKDKKAELEEQNNSPILGSKDGHNIVVAFFDYNCGYCKKGDQVLRILLSENPDVKVILKPLPILGELSAYAVNMSLAVFKLHPDKFPSVHHSLMDMPHITHESISAMLKDHGINVDELTKEIESSDVKSIVEKNFHLAEALKIKGAPAYIVNGKMFPGLIDIHQFKEALLSKPNESPAPDEAQANKE